MPVLAREWLRLDQGWWGCPTHGNEPAWDLNFLSGTADSGLPVVASALGVVCRTVETLGPYGRVLVIRYTTDATPPPLSSCSTRGQFGRFAHLLAFAVAPGQTVHQGQVVAYIGGSGHGGSCASDDYDACWTTHLHYNLFGSLSPTVSAGGTDFLQLPMLFNTVGNSATPPQASSCFACSASPPCACAVPPHPPSRCHGVTARVCCETDPRTYYSVNQLLLAQAYARYGSSIGRPATADDFRAEWLMPYQPWFFDGTDGAYARDGVALNQYQVTLIGEPDGQAALIYDALGGARDVRVVQHGFGERYLEAWCGPNGCCDPERLSLTCTPILGLGAPLTDEYGLGASGARQDFARGYLQWDAARREITRHSYSGAAPGWMASGWDRVRSYAFADAYARLGAAAVLGEAFDAGGGARVHDWRPLFPMMTSRFGVLIQDFQAPAPLCGTDASSRRSVLIHQTANNQALQVRCGFWAAYRCLTIDGISGGGPFLLGAPRTEEYDPVGPIRSAQEFDGGYIWFGPDDSLGIDRIHVHVSSESLRVRAGFASSCAGTALFWNPPGPPTCTNECEVGEQRCSDEHHRIWCGAGWDSDACLEWPPAGVAMACGSGIVCRDGDCVPESSTCGGMGQPCCDGNRCNGLLACASGLCTETSLSDGGLDGSVAIDASDATTDTGPCAACTPGDLGCTADRRARLSCVGPASCPRWEPTSTCTPTDTTVCVPGFGCLVCGTVGQACCATGCGSGFVCDPTMHCVPSMPDAGVVDGGAFDAGAGDSGIDAGTVCTTPEILCGGVCVDPRTDPANCGACGNVCGAGFVCSMSACRCPGSLTVCGGSCVDAMTSTAHCGGCGRPCTLGETCMSGTCVGAMDAGTPCSSGYHLCTGSCASNLAVTTCGSLCSPCPAPTSGMATCDGTSCGFVCNAGFHACGGSCVSNTSITSCGTTSCSPCAAAPPNAAPTCDGATCGFVCDAGFHRCGSACVSNTSTATCGSTCTPCPTASNSVATCTAGTCGFVCASSFADCNGVGGDGCEASLASNATCGSCANVCSGATPVCQLVSGSYTCTSGCPAGEANCGGSCVILATDPRNCGACANSCAVPTNGASTCATSTCGVTCNSGFHACGLACASNASTASCGTSCTSCPAPPPNATASCDGTTCGFICNPGYTLASGTCVRAITVALDFASINTRNTPCGAGGTAWRTVIWGPDGAHTSSPGAPIFTVAADSSWVGYSEIGAYCDDGRYAAWGSTGVRARLAGVRSILVGGLGEMVDNTIICWFGSVAMGVGDQGNKPSIPLSLADARTCRTPVRVSGTGIAPQVTVPADGAPVHVFNNRSQFLAVTSYADCAAGLLPMPEFPDPTAQLWSVCYRSPTPADTAHPNAALTAATIVSRQWNDYSYAGYETRTDERFREDFVEVSALGAPNGWGYGIVIELHVGSYGFYYNFLNRYAAPAVPGDNPWLYAGGVLMAGQPCTLNGGMSLVRVDPAPMSRTPERIGATMDCSGGCSFVPLGDPLPAMTFACMASTPVCGNTVCEAGEGCAAPGTAGACPGDCCLSFEDFERSDSFRASPPDYTPAAPVIRIAELRHHVESPLTGTVGIAGGSFESETFGTLGGGRYGATTYLRFTGLPPDLRLRLLVRYRCRDGGHALHFTGSTGTTADLGCGLSWVDGTAFSGSPPAFSDSLGAWSVTMSSGDVADRIYIDFLGIQRW